jgi:hypothetical protein
MKFIHLYIALSIVIGSVFATGFIIDRAMQGQNAADLKLMPQYGLYLPTIVGASKKLVISDEYYEGCIIEINGICNVSYSTFPDGNFPSLHSDSNSFTVGSTTCKSTQTMVRDSAGNLECAN